MKKTLLWVLAAFMLISAIVFFPSVSTIFAFLFAVLCAPVPKVQEFLAEKKFKGWIKTAVLVVLFVACVMTAPVEKTTPAENESQIEADSGEAGTDELTLQNSEEASTEEPESPAEPEEQEEQAESEDAPQEDSEEPTVKINTDFDTEGYTRMDAEVLFEYGSYLAGEKVLTVITVSDIDKTAIKANTDNNDSLFFSVNCEFSEKEAISWINEDDVVTVAGTVKSGTTRTIQLIDCVIVGQGEIGEELSAGIEAQKEIGEEAKKAEEEAAAQIAKEARDSYIDQCTEVDYVDVERNPDNYDGTYVKINGTVEQVLEGWFDSVALRVNCSGNMWYVTYTRQDGESRILEGDNLTCYGECTGTKSYTSVLGSQVTIPSIDMEYYELN